MFLTVYAGDRVSITEFEVERDNAEIPDLAAGRGVHRHRFGVGVRLDRDGHVVVEVGVEVVRAIEIIPFLRWDR